MAYKFDPRKLITNFAKDNPSVEALKFIRDDPEDFQISDLSAHGMMNFIFRAKSADGDHSVIIKYGETTARLDPNEEVTLERQVMEYSAMELLETVIPGGAPKPYCLDRNHNIIAMEDMSSWELLGEQLLAGCVDLEAAASLGRLLAKIHVSTSQKHVLPQRWQELLDKFDHEEMRTDCMKFQFERTYDATEPTNKIPDSVLPAFRKFTKEISDMGIPEKQKRLYVKECFIHADCHWKSVFVKDGQASLLDLEFCFIGPAAENVSHPISAYLFCYNTEDEQEVTSEKRQFQKDCVQAVRNLLCTYMDSHPDLSDKSATADFLTQVAIFLGGVLVLLGTYYAMDEVTQLTDANRSFLLTRGFEVLISHEDMNTVDNFIKILFQI